MDVLTLARIQFAANISFHILFPTITIGLAWVLVYFKLRFQRSGEAFWMQAYQFWIKVFALSFALGVVSGVTMSFQFGTNWPGYMNSVGNIAGPLLGYEVLTAFFLEATFLGIMLFGSKRVSPRMHTTSTILVAVGTSLSAFWILALNSWMHTPQGHELRDGVAHVVSWWEVIFNPSFPYRLTHVLLACGLTNGFLLAGLSAYRWLRGDRSVANRMVLRTGTGIAAILIPLQIFVGDLHGLNTLQHQPAKVAAIEAVWQDTKCAPLLLFALPDEPNRENHLELGVPCGASLILTHTLDGEIQGLDSFTGQHPPVAPVFFAFRIMVGIGVLMLLVSWYGTWRNLRRYEPSVPYLRLLVAMTFCGWIATLAGWYVTEIGRQPFLVSGILRTADAVSPESAVSATAIATSLTLYLVVYGTLLVAYVSTIFYLARRASSNSSTSSYEGDLAVQGAS